VESPSLLSLTAPGHFGRGDHALGASLAASVRAFLRREADNVQEHAKVHQRNARRYKGTADGDLAGDDAHEAREAAGRLKYHADRAGRLSDSPARSTKPREVTPGTGPLAGQAAAACQLAADVRKSPVQGTYYSDREFPDLVPTDTRYMASTELELAAARLDQENEPLGRSHLANARRILDSRKRAAGRGGWERLNDEQPSPADFQAEAFHHADRAGMIEDSLTAIRDGGNGQPQAAGPARDRRTSRDRDGSRGRRPRL
jgi:hypothetical protein